jgi:hypothetical protein
MVTATFDVTVTGSVEPACGKPSEDVLMASAEAGGVVPPISKMVVKFVQGVAAL